MITSILSIEDIFINNESRSFCLRCVSSEIDNRKFRLISTNFYILEINVYIFYIHNKKSIKYFVNITFDPSYNGLG